MQRDDDREGAGRLPLGFYSTTALGWERWKRLNLSVSCLGRSHLPDGRLAIEGLPVEAQEELHLFWEVAHAFTGAGTSSGAMTIESMRLSMMLPLTLGDRGWFENWRNRKPEPAVRSEAQMPENRDEDTAAAVAALFVVHTEAEA